MLEYLIQMMMKFQVKLNLYKQVILGIPDELYNEHEFFQKSQT